MDAALLAGTGIRAEKGLQVLSDGKGIVEGLSLIAAEGNLLKNRAAIKKYLAIREASALKRSILRRDLSPCSKDRIVRKRNKDNSSKFNYNSRTTESDIQNLKTAEYLKMRILLN